MDIAALLAPKTLDSFKEKANEFCVSQVPTDLTSMFVLYGQECELLVSKLVITGIRNKNKTTFKRKTVF